MNYALCASGAIGCNSHQGHGNGKAAHLAVLGFLIMCYLRPSLQLVSSVHSLISGVQKVLQKSLLNDLSKG